MVEKCLEKDPHRRYASPLDLLQALEAAVADPQPAAGTSKSLETLHASRLDLATQDSKPATRPLESEPTIPIQTVEQQPATRVRRYAWLSTPVAASLLAWHYMAAFLGKS